MQGQVPERKLGLFPSVSIVVANMIGAGIFTTSGLLLSELNDPMLMIILWFVGGLIALCGALSYGELGAAIPEAGGEYRFLSDLYHPLFGFLSGWVSFTVGFSAPIAASAMGFSEYFTRAIPSVTGWFSYVFELSPSATGKILSITAILLFTTIHFFGLKLGTAVQNLLTLLKVGLIIFLIMAGFASGNGDFSNFSAAPEHETGTRLIKSMGLSLMWIMFAYSGWNASTYIGAEIRNPKRTLPLSLLAGTAVVMILYMGLNALYVYSTEPESMKGVITVGGLAMSRLFGQSADTLFSLLVSFALFSSLSAFIIIGPRVYYSMARDGLFFRSAGRLHPRFRVPSNSIILQGLIAAIMVLSGTFEQILTYMGFALGIFPLMAVAGVFILRKRKPDIVRLPGFPFVQIIYITAGIAILLLSFAERTAESMIALATVAAGIPVYYLFKKRGL